MSPAMAEEEDGGGVVVFVVVISRVSCAPFGFFVFVEEKRSKVVGSRARRFISELEFNCQMFSVHFNKKIHFRNDYPCGNLSESSDTKVPWN